MAGSGLVRGLSPVRVNRGPRFGIVRFGIVQNPVPRAEFTRTKTTVHFGSGELLLAGKNAEPWFGSGGSGGGKKPGAPLTAVVGGSESIEAILG